MNANIDVQVVRDFGIEWRRFDQSGLSEDELRAAFDRYFAIFPWDRIPPNARGFDLGCGSGRWAIQAALRVGELHCIDPSAGALEVARRNLSGVANCRFHLASVDAMPLDDNSMDFGYSLGVLHHIPDTERGIRSCVEKLKPGAPLLVYLYYAFDNRPKWFAAVWKGSDYLRRIVSKCPYPLKYGVSQALAALIYFPLARLSGALAARGVRVDNIPLSSYSTKSFYTMRTDAFDRFGTRLEHRFTKKEIAEMMENAGLTNIRFSAQPPYWCAAGYKK